MTDVKELKCKKLKISNKQLNTKTKIRFLI